MAEPRRARERKRKKDLALVFGPSEDGEGLHVLRQRAATGVVEAGTVRPLRDGHAIVGEVVALQPRADSPFLFDCETDRELSTTTAGGPPQVASNDYRRGWDAMFGGRARSADVN